MFKSTKGLIFGRAKSMQRPILVFGEETDGSTDQALPPITLDAGAVQRLQHAKELLTPLDSLGIDTYPIENAKTVFGQYDPDLRKHLTRLHLPELSDRLVWIPPHLFKDIQQVAVGGFATVYTAGVEIPPQTYRFWDELLLGDRILLKEVDQTLLQELVFSIELSLHVVTARVFGLSQNTRTGQYLMCMEYARGGNLEQYPQHSDWHTVFEIANELAEKLYQMHKVGIIHQDLHAGNVVFFSNPKSKPSDIGIWSDLQQTYLYRQRQALRIIDVGLGKAVENWHDNDGVYGRLAYHPPEIFNMQGYTKASDIYCLGTLLWQIVTTVPPQGVANQMCEGREDGLREDLIPGAPEGYNDIIRMCWEQDPSNRPNISTVSILFTMMRSDSDKTAIPFSRETKAFIKKRRAAHAKEIKKKDSFAFVSNASRFTTREELEQIINSQC